MTRQQHIDYCCEIAIELMQSPRGQEAAAGGYYLRLFTWLYGEIERGRIPAGVPKYLVEEWRGIRGRKPE